MKIVAVPKFLTPFGAIEFVPVSDVPGSSHRVAIDGALQQLWLPQGKLPNRAAAKFFIRVHRALIEGRPKYYYADRNEDPALPNKVTS